MATTHATVELSQLDPWLSGQLWGHKAYQWVQDVAAEWLTDGSNYDGDIEQWAAESADSDVIYHSDALEIWQILSGSAYADPAGVPEFHTATEAITAEAYLAAYTVRIAVASVLSGGE
ncbi:MAG: hypothetical protein KDB71_09610 [Mycobacterium sp.]|nr:hypothetical protein [Mycobacterium sp.]